MKIAYTHHAFLEQRYGGVSRYILELSCRIAKKTDVEAKIVSPLYRNQYLRKKENKELTFGAFTDFPKMHRLAKPVNELISEAFLKKFSPDVIHLTTFELHKNKSIKTVVTVHDMIPELFGESFKEEVKNRFIKNKKLAVAKADHIICVSESTRRDLIELLEVDSSKVTVIHHGISTEPAVPFIKRDSFNPYILYVGARGGYKNFRSFMKAYSLSKIREEVKIICFGGGGFSNDEIGLMHELGILGSEVKHLSGDDRLLCELYRNADLLIYPSIYEGFGLPPLEAMANDCPVVCSNTSSIPEVAGSAAEYFDPRNLEDIIFALENVFFSKQRKKELIRLGRERVKLFSWENTADKTLQVYSLLA